MTSKEFIQRKIITKLYSLGKWNKNHLLIDNLESGFPVHCIKCIKKEVLQLIKEGILATKKSKHGLAVSLNIRRKEEIETILNKELFFSL